MRKEQKAMKKLLQNSTKSGGKRKHKKNILVDSSEDEWSAEESSWLIGCYDHIILSSDIEENSTYKNNDESNNYSEPSKNTAPIKIVDKGLFKLQKR